MKTYTIQQIKDYLYSQWNLGDAKLNLEYIDDILKEKKELEDNDADVLDDNMLDCWLETQT